MSALPQLLVIGCPSPLADALARVVSTWPDLETVLLVSEAERAQVEAMTAGFARRPLLLSGSSFRIDLGLTGAEFAALSRRLVAIVHAPDQGALLGARTPAAGQEVGRELVELAGAAPGLKLLVHVSHVRAVDAPRPRRRMDRLVGKGGVADGLAALVRSERVLQRFARTLPLCLVRPGWLVSEESRLLPIPALLWAAHDPGTDDHAWLGLARHRLPLVRLSQALSQITGLLRQGLDGVGVGAVVNLAEVPTVAALIAHLDACGRPLIPGGLDLTAVARRRLLTDTGLPPRELLLHMTLPPAWRALPLTDPGRDEAGLEGLLPLSVVAHTVEELCGLR